MRLSKRIERLERCMAPARGSQYCRCAFEHDEVVAELAGEVVLGLPCVRCGRPVALALAIVESEAELAG